MKCDERKPVFYPQSTNFTASAGMYSSLQVLQFARWLSAESRYMYCYLTAGVKIYFTQAGSLMYPIWF